MSAKLMKARAWAKREFASDSVPINRTVRGWVENGRVKGQIVGKHVYVYEDQRFGVDAEISSTVSNLISQSVA